jgi:rhomboid family GlyGly-CTERM serine protease
VPCGGRCLSKPWLLLAAALAKLSLIAGLLPVEALNWQPALLAAEPWRLFTAALAHLSGLHLGANLAGCAVLALLGWRADLPPRAAAAWLLAWPLTQAGLLLRPELTAYAGLSGLLHAGVAIAALDLLARSGRARGVGLGIAGGLAVKLALEAPFGPVLRTVPGFDFAVAPFAHLSGAGAGLLAGALTMRVAQFKKESHGT